MGNHPPFLIAALILISGRGQGFRRPDSGQNLPLVVGNPGQVDPVIHGVGGQLFGAHTAQGIRIGGGFALHRVPKALQVFRIERTR